MKEWATRNPDEVKRRRRKQYLRKRRNPVLWARENKRLRDLRAKNIERRREWEAAYRRKNKKRLDRIARKYRSGNIQWLLSNRLRTRIRLAMKAKNVAKCKKTVELVGCSVQELKRHIESQFTRGMSWQKMGMIHLDHKIPLASFDLEDAEQQRLAFHYTNLQPLWARDNLTKGAKMQ